MDTTKFVSHFSDFSVIFYTIYKNQQTTLTIGVTVLQLRPWKDLNVRNVVPMAADRRGFCNSGEAGGVLARGRGGGGSRGVLGLVWAGIGGGETAGRSGPRLPAAAAAGAAAPAQQAPGWGLG
jgi:hypothetical protein